MYLGLGSYLSAVDAAGNVMSGADPSTAFPSGSSDGTLPPAGSVKAAFNADSVHTSQWQIDPRPFFNQGTSNGLTPNQLLAKVGSPPEEELAFAKAQLDGWGSSRPDFDYWTNNPPELRWAATLYQVGGAPLAQARGLDPAVAQRLYDWSNWMTAWRYTFPTVNINRWKLPGFLQTLRLVQNPAQKNVVTGSAAAPPRPEGSASAGLPGIPGGNPVTHEFIPLSFLSPTMSYTDLYGVTQLMLLDGRRWIYTKNADGTVNLLRGTTADGTGKVDAAPAPGMVAPAPPIPYVPGSKVFVPVQTSGQETTILLPGASSAIPISQYTGPNFNPMPGGLPSLTTPGPDGLLTPAPAVETTTADTAPAAAGLGTGLMGLLVVGAVVGLALKSRKGRRPKGYKRF